MFGLEAKLNGKWVLTDRVFDDEGEANQRRLEEEKMFNKPFRVVRVRKTIEDIINNPHYPVKVRRITYQSL